MTKNPDSANNAGSETVGGIGPSEMLNVNYEKLVSRADVRLDRPVSRRESGMPLGNGVMGSLVVITQLSL